MMRGYNYNNRYYKRFNHLMHSVLHHQYSLIGWTLALREGRIRPKAKLIHVDAPEHYDDLDYNDDNVPSCNSLKLYLTDRYTPEMIVRSFTIFLNKCLPGNRGEQSFIPFALYLELIDDEIIYVPSGDPSKMEPRTRFYYVYENERGDHWPHLIENKPKEAEYRAIRFHICSIDDLSTLVKDLSPEQLILGIDGDHFAYLPQLGEEPSENQTEKVVDDFAGKLDFTPGVITISESRRYMKSIDPDFLLGRLVEKFNKKFSDRI